MTIKKSSGNVFQDLGFDDAQELSYKANLVLYVKKAMETRNLTQTEAAKLCNTDQPTLSKVLRGRLDLVSTDRLFSWLTSLGLMIRITVDFGGAGGVQVCSC